MENSKKNHLFSSSTKRNVPTKMMLYAIRLKIEGAILINVEMLFADRKHKKKKTRIHHSKTSAFHAAVRKRKS